MHHFPATPRLFTAQNTSSISIKHTGNAMAQLQLLQSIVDAIERIQAWSEASGSAEAFGKLVGGTMTDLLRLLDHDVSRQLPLQCTVSRRQHVLLDFYLLYTKSKHIAPQIEQVDLVDQIKNYHNDHVDSHARVLGQLLNEVDLEPSIVSSVSDLFEFFERLHRRAEAALVDYLTRCIDYEIQHASIIRTDVNYALDEDITEQLIHKLDQVEDSGVPHPIYQHLEIPTIVPPALELTVNDSLFMDFYSLFLEILTYKNKRFGGPPHEYKRYIRVMVDLYMRSRAIGSLELDSFEVKEEVVNYLYDFVNQDVVKTSDRKLARAASLAFDKLELLPHAEPEARTPPLESLDDRKLSMAERSTLISQVREFIPDLNDFNFDFNSHFSVLLATYFELMYDEMGTKIMAEDRLFVSDLNKTIKQIAKFNYGDDDVDIKAMVLHFQSLHSYIIELQPTFLMRAALMIFNQTLSTRRHQFKSWHLKYLKRVHLLHKLYQWNRKFKVQHRFLNVWFEKTKRNQSIAALGVLYSAKRSQAGALQRWQNEMERHNSNNNDAKSQSIKRYFSGWHTKAENSKVLIARADLFNKKNIYRRAFTALEGRKNDLDAHRVTADSFASEVFSRRSAVLTKSAFDKWISQVNESFAVKVGANNQQTDSIGSNSMDGRLRLLLATEKRFVLSKFYSKIIRMDLLRTAMRTVQLKNQGHVVRVFFCLWQRVSIVSEILKQYKAKQSHAIKREFWNTWINQVHIKLAQTKFRREKSLQWAFNIWYSKLGESRRDLRLIQLPLITVSFNQWKLRFQLQVWRRERDSAAVKRLFEKIKMRHQERSNRSLIAQTFDERRITKAGFDRWKNRQDDYSASYESLNSLTLVKHYKSWKRRFSEIQAMNDVQTKLGFISDTLSVKLHFKLWRKKQEEKYSLYVEEKVDFFRLKLQAPLVKSVYLRHWMQRMIDIRQRESTMEDMCSDFQRQSNVLRLPLFRWKNLLRSTKELEEDAVDFERKMLMKKALVIWFEQYNRKFQLMELSSDFRDQHNFSKLREVLNAWSLKVLKYVKRNQQSCTLFIQKWDQSRTRDFFDLWRANLANHDNTHEEADTSVSNQSPLASKSTRNFSGSPSYLNTPLRRSPPRGSSGSNSRLESTTLRVKNQRIDALKRRFESARSSSYNERDSRNVSQNYQRSYVRLLPPKVRSSYRSILPPEPPNFDIRGMNTPNLSQVDEMSIIATAKKLRRITPILIPAEDDDDQIVNSEVIF